MSTPKESYSAVFVAAAAFAALTALVAAGALTGVDRYAAYHLMPWRELTPHHLLDPRSLFVPRGEPTLASTLVGLWTYPASVFVSGLVVLATRRFRFVALWVVANALELLGKLTITRPSVGVSAFRHSYPSGHTLRAFVVAAVVVWTWRRLGPVAVAWALTVPFALVALGDHVPSDVAGGALLAVCLVALASPNGPTSWPALAFGGVRGRS